MPWHNKTGSSREESGYALEPESDPWEYLSELNYTATNDDNEIPFLNITAADNQTFEMLVIALNKYGLPAIIFVGIIGNSLSLLVFLASHLRYQSSSVYLAFLNVADIIFLLCLSPIWLGWLKVYLIHKNGWCQTIVFLSYVSGFLSVWTVVAFTVERFLVVYYPLQRHEYCTRRRSTLVVIVLSSTAIILYSFSLWTTGLLRIRSRNTCLTMPKYEPLLRILTAIDTLVTLVVPSLMIIVFNILIGIKVWHFLHFDEEESARATQIGLTEQSAPNQEPKAKGPPRVPASGSQLERPRTRSRGSSHREEPCTFRRHPSINMARQNSIQLKTTQTLLIISSIFVVLNLPSHAFRISITVKYLTSDSTLLFSRTLLLWQQVFQILYYANFSTNFFLYCTYSKTFRVEFQRMITRLKRKLLRRVENLRAQNNRPRIPLTSPVLQDGGP